MHKILARKSSNDWMICRMSVLDCVLDQTIGTRLLIMNQKYFYLWEQDFHQLDVIHMASLILVIIGLSNVFTCRLRWWLFAWWHKAITSNSANLCSVKSFGVNFMDVLIKTKQFWLQKIHLRISVKWQPLCLSLSVLVKQHRLTRIDFTNILHVTSTHWILNKINKCRLIFS